MRLHETVIDHINSSSVIPEECANLFRANANLLIVGVGWALGLVLREHVLWSVDILAEVEVVDFLGVATITVTASNEVKHRITGRHDIQVLHHAQELLGSDVLRLGPVKVSESWLEKDSV